jgi:hypothetical protein
MRRLMPLLVVLALAGPPAMAQSYYFSPDVPTDLTGATYLPWEVVRKDSPGVYSVVVGASQPAYTAVDSLHAMCSGNWLLSVEATEELPAGSGAYFEPWDVIEYDPALVTHSQFFCGGPIGLPPGTNVDAAFLRGDDRADLVISFETVVDLTSLGGGIYEPADLIQWQRNPPGGTMCWEWAIVPSPGDLFFDGSGATPPVQNYSDVSGADRWLNTTITFDVPTTLGIPTYQPGQLVNWDPSIPGFLLYDSPPWPVDRSSRMDAFSFLPGPGEVPSMHVNKSGVTPGNIVVTWNPSLSAGAEDYAVYEGTLGSWYSHSPAPTTTVCSDTLADLTEDFTPQTADSYYLVVALNPNAEGSYGQRTGPTERPQLSGSCRSGQDFDCP